MWRSGARSRAETGPRRTGPEGSSPDREEEGEGRRSRPPLATRAVTRKPARIAARDSMAERGRAEAIHVFSLPDRESRVCRYFGGQNRGPSRFTVQDGSRMPGVSTACHGILQRTSCTIARGARRSAHPWPGRLPTCSAGETAPADLAAQRCAQPPGRHLPRRASPFLLDDGGGGLPHVRLGDDRDDRSHLFGRGLTAQHLDARRGPLGIRLVHSGMFPCFLGGSSARLPRRARSAFAIVTRVLAGSMMPSISPRSAARNGEVTL